MGNHSIQVNSMTKMYRNFMNIYGEKKSPADFTGYLGKKAKRENVYGRIQRVYLR